MTLPRVLALTPGDVSDAGTSGLLRAIRTSLNAGLRGIMLREERLSDRAWLAVAREVRAACDQVGGAWFGVHDRVHLARHVGADGVHLGFRSLSPQVVCERFGSEFAIGLSTHDDPVSSTASLGTDYVFFGPVRPTPSKPTGTPGWRAPVGFDGLRRRCEALRDPVFALGGMRPEDVAPARRAGAYGVAVLAGILSATDPASATRAYMRALEKDSPAR